MQKKLMDRRGGGSQGMYIYDGGVDGERAPRIERIPLSIEGLSERIKERLGCEETLPSRVIFVSYQKFYDGLTPNLYQDYFNLKDFFLQQGCTSVLSYLKFDSDPMNADSMAASLRNKISFHEKDRHDLTSIYSKKILEWEELWKIARDNFKDTLIVFVADENSLSSVVYNCAGGGPPPGEAKYITLMATPRSEWPKMLGNGEENNGFNLVEWEKPRDNPIVEKKQRAEIARQIAVLLSPMDVVSTDAIRGLINHLRVMADVGIETAAYRQFSLFDYTGAVVSDQREIQKRRVEWQNLDSNIKREVAKFIIARSWPTEGSAGSIVDAARYPEVFCMTILHLWSLDENCINRSLLEGAKRFMSTLLNEMVNKVQVELGDEEKKQQIVLDTQAEINRNKTIWDFFQNLYIAAPVHPEFNTLFKAVWHVLAQRAVRDACTAPVGKPQEQAIVYATGLINRAQQAGVDISELTKRLPQIISY